MFKKNFIFDFQCIFFFFFDAVSSIYSKVDRHLPWNGKWKKMKEKFHCDIWSVCLCYIFFLWTEIISFVFFYEINSLPMVKWNWWWWMSTRWYWCHIDIIQSECDILQWLYIFLLLFLLIVVQSNKTMWTNNSWIN